jgi:hypothetical protein
VGEEGGADRRSAWSRRRTGRSRTACARRCREHSAIPPPSSEIMTNRGFVVWRREACVRARGIAAFRLDGDHECPSDGVRTEFGRSLRNGWCEPSTPTVAIHARASKLRSRLRRRPWAMRAPERASCEAGCGGVLRRCEHQSEQVAKQVAAVSFGDASTRASKLRSRLRALKRRLTPPRTRGTRRRARGPCAGSRSEGSCRLARGTSRVPREPPAKRRSPQA